MNQDPQQASLWTRFVNWLLGLFRGSAGPSAGDRAGRYGTSGSPSESSGAGTSTNQSGGTGSRSADTAAATASRVSEAGETAIERGGEAWDHLLGKDEQPSASNAPSRADGATSNTAIAGSEMGAGATASATPAAAADLTQEPASYSEPSGPAIGDTGSQVGTGTGAMNAGATMRGGAGAESSPAAATASSDMDQLDVDGELRQGGEDATAYARSGAGSPSATAGAGTDALLSEQPSTEASPSRSSSTSASSATDASASSPSSSAPEDALSSTEMTGIEREAAERARQQDTAARTSPHGMAADAGQTGQAARSTPMGQGGSDQIANQQDARTEGDESDRLTLLAEPPVAGEDVVISSSSVTGDRQSQISDTAADETAAAINDESLKQAAGGTAAATAASRSYADAEVGLSDESADSSASSATPSGADAEFVAGTDIEWSSPAEWEELEEETEISAPVQGSGGPTAAATASDQATVPHGAIPGDGSRECPSDHPIKGNANSKIYHMPGQSSYEGTEPEYCFANEDDAIAAGYRASKARGRTDAGDGHANQPQDAGHDRADQTAGVAASTATGIAAQGATEPATTAERERSLQSDADISATPPAAITSRPGTNQPMGQAAGGSMAGAPMQSATSSPSSGTETGASHEAATHRGSVPGDGSRTCPDDYPIKGNQNSMIYHMPNQSSYQGTKAEICFATEEDAIAAGYRRRREAGESGSDAHGHHTDHHGRSSTAPKDTASPTTTAQSGTPSGSVAADGLHDCPQGYPIKGNASSRIYHMPGQSAYDVTDPEFCFATEEAATAAGYRAAKR